MTRNVAEIAKWAVIDTCAVWNILSSHILFRACVAAGFEFTVTSFVLYECLHKPRKHPSAEDVELMERLRTARDKQHFKSISLTVDDLQDVAYLELRKKVSKGELSSIAFARRARVPFQTDDQGARKLAAEVLPQTHVQTTPHVLGWLFFHRKLLDHELGIIIKQHEELVRPLRRFFEEMYNEALRCRLMEQGR